MVRPTRPGDLLDLRTSTLKTWKAVLAEAEGQYDERSNYIRKTLRFPMHVFQAGDLWWVTRDSLQVVAEGAADTLPPDTKLESDWWRNTSPDGKTTDGSDGTDRGYVVVFEHPILGFDSETGERDLPVDAVIVGWVKIEQDAAESHGQYALACCSMSFAGGDTLLPLGHSTWPVNEPLSDVEFVPDAFNETPWRSKHPTDVSTAEQAFEATATEDRRITAAIWLLATSKGLGALTPASVPRPFARRAERAGMPSDVQIVHLPGVERDGTGGDADQPQSGRLPYTVTFPVRGHWRNQPHGPGGTLRRPQWIDSYLKGDGPLRIKERVSVVRPPSS